MRSEKREKRAKKLKMGGWRKNALGGLNTIVRGVALLVAAIFGYDLRYLTLCSLCSFRADVHFGG